MGVPVLLAQSITRKAGVSLAGGFDVIYSKDSDTIAAYATTEGSVSATDTFSTIRRFGYGGWSAGVTFNMDHPDQFARSMGFSGDWPLSTIHLLCRAGLGRASSMWGFACQTQKLGLANTGVTAGMGFVGLSGPAYLTFSPGTSLGTDLYSWQYKITDSHVLRNVKRIIAEIGGVPKTGKGLAELWRRLNGIPMPQAGN